MGNKLMEKDRRWSKMKLAGVVIAIGIVYGDIGTSPLYVMKSILNALPQHRPEDVIGAVSCIIWTLTVQTTVKYVLITLRADNNGEGGILALFALIKKRFRWAYIIAAVGAATLLADGIITPSISVLSAVEGLHNAYPEVSIVPVSLGIIFFLFVLQPFGTASLGKFFGVIMFGWFLMLGLLGVSNFEAYPALARAFNPIYALRFILTTPNVLIILGAVFLCTTGAEALYSDLGHCGLKNIRISWVYIKICLILNYLGQGAWILLNPSKIVPDVNPFFQIMPGWFSPIGLVMATLAAIIASQALISGSFSVISEAISLNLWPNINIKYPSEEKGQMFIPSINTILMVLCLLVIVMFRSSSNMEAAYGLAITVTMLMTTILLFLYFRVREVPLLQSIPITVCFLTIEIGFLIANSMKFRHGGYVVILIAGVIFLVMFIWYNGRRIKNHCVTYEKIDPLIPILSKMSEDKEIPKTATHLVYIIRAKYSTDIDSKVVYSLLNRRPKRADTYWFVYLGRSERPYEFKYKVKTFVKKKIFRVDISAGFKLGVHMDDYVKQIALELQAGGEVDLLSRYSSLRENDIMGDFKFMVVERVMRSNIKLSFYQKTMMSLYGIVKRSSTSDTKILDLDPSNVVVESAPLQNS